MRAAALAAQFSSRPTRAGHDEAVGAYLPESRRCREPRET